MKPEIFFVTIFRMNSQNFVCSPQQPHDCLVSMNVKTKQCNQHRNWFPSAREMDWFLLHWCRLLFPICVASHGHPLLYFRVFFYCFILYSCFDSTDGTNFAYKINEKKLMRKTDVLLSYLLCPYRFELIVYVHTNDNNKKNFLSREWMGVALCKKNAQPTHNK